MSSKIIRLPRKCSLLFYPSHTLSSLLVSMGAANLFSTEEDARPDTSQTATHCRSLQRYPPYSKRQRLSTACNECRKRKVRCDEGQPQCRNCTLKGRYCVTTDPHEPSREVARRRPPNISQSSSPLVERARSHTSSYQQASHVSTPGTRSQAKCPPDFGLSSPTSFTAASPERATDGRDRTEIEAQQPIESVQSRSSDNSYDREMIINTEHSSRKRKVLGHGTLQALAMYLDRYFERQGWETINARFPFGMQHAEEGPLNEFVLGFSLPPIPDLQSLEVSMSIYAQRIHPMCPVLDLESFKISIQRLALQDLRRIAPGDIPILSSLYSLLSIISDELPGAYTTEGYSYLCAGYALSPYVTGSPYFSSVQAMLLLTLALRGRNKDGAAWQTLGQAIRIAQSIGLHRRVDCGVISTPKMHVHEDREERLGSLVWWTCYCLEKSMGLEVGRPIAIRDTDCNQVQPAEEAENKYIISWIGLAQIQSRLIDILYHRLPEKRKYR